MYRSSQNIINFLFAFYILANFASLNASSKEDRAKGMVLLSFYGDSLGLPGEFNFDVKQYALGSKSSHYSNAFYNDPWAIWNTSKSIAKEEKGIISDDSYFKLFLLNSYFKFLSDKKRNHSDMLLYDHLFSLRSKPLKSDKQQPWFNAYQEHLSDWFKMYDISQCLSLIHI